MFRLSFGTTNTSEKDKQSRKKQKICLEGNLFHAKANFLPLFDNYYNDQKKRRRLFPIKTNERQTPFFLLLK